MAYGVSVCEGAPCSRIPGPHLIFPVFDNSSIGTVNVTACTNNCCIYITVRRHKDRISLRAQFMATLVRMVVVPQWTEHTHLFLMCVQGVPSLNLSWDPNLTEVLMVLLSASRKILEW